MGDMITGSQNRLSWLSVSEWVLQSWLFSNAILQIVGYVIRAVTCTLIINCFTVKLLVLPACHFQKVLNCFILGGMRAT